MAFRLPAALLPVKKASGKWVAPAIRPRMANAIRKNAVLNGKCFVGADIEKGEWDPMWEHGNKAVVMREPKGKLRWRKREERVAGIEAAMAKMDDDIKEYYASKAAARATDLYDREFKRAGLLKNTEESKGKKKKGPKA